MCEQVYHGTADFSVEAPIIWLDQFDRVWRTTRTQSVHPFEVYLYAARPRKLPPTRNVLLPFSSRTWMSVGFTLAAAMAAMTLLVLMNGGMEVEVGA